MALGDTHTVFGWQALLVWLWCRAWSAWVARSFAWQAWHLVSGAYGTGLALVARLVGMGAGRFCLAGAAFVEVVWQAWDW